MFWKIWVFLNNNLSYIVQSCYAQLFIQVWKMENCQWVLNLGTKVEEEAICSLFVKFHHTNHALKCLVGKVLFSQPLAEPVEYVGIFPNDCFSSFWVIELEYTACCPKKYCHDFLICFTKLGLILIAFAWKIHYLECCLICGVVCFYLQLYNGIKVLWRCNLTSPKTPSKLSHDWIHVNCKQLWHPSCE